jgi:UDP-glucose 4-epimerase
MTQNISIGIFGLHSYIGNRFAHYVEDDDYWKVQFINSRTDEWENLDFSQYDVLVHAAAVVHSSKKPSLEEAYFAINRDLPIRVASKAKNEGVGQFIFLSSMLVYGDSDNMNHAQCISKTTEPHPTDFYGKSKLEAEKELLHLQTDGFVVSLPRLPMVYGEGCKGNFPRLVNLALHTVVFPDIENQRSMIYVDNLCEFLKLSIMNRYSGILFPQNSEYVATKRIVAYVAEHCGHHIFFTPIFNELLRYSSRKMPAISKLFGTKIYDKSLSPNLDRYNLVGFEESISRYLGKFYNT